MSKEREHLKTETVQHCGRDVTVASHHLIDESVGFAVVDFEARCGDRVIHSRMTVAGALDHGLHQDYDLAQFEKDHAAETRRIAAIAESRHRAAALCAQFAAKHAPEPVVQEKVQEKG